MTTASKQDTLLLCPFCGSDALKISPNVHTQLLRVQCESCWATSVTSNQRSTIIAAWNRRPHPFHPCPFCLSFNISLGDSETLPDGNYLTCNNCKADGPVKTGQREAIAAWNQREADATIRILLEALHDICKPVTVAADAETTSFVNDLHKLLAARAQAAIDKVKP
jgi:Lar family restriction alleviation protein